MSLICKLETWKTSRTNWKWKSMSCRRIEWVRCSYSSNWQQLSSSSKWTWRRPAPYRNWRCKSTLSHIKAYNSSLRSCKAIQIAFILRYMTTWWNSINNPQTNTYTHSRISSHRQCKMPWIANNISNRFNSHLFWSRSNSSNNSRGSIISWGNWSSKLKARLRSTKGRKWKRLKLICRL